MIDGEPRPSSGTATLRTVPIAIPDPRRRAAAGVDRAPAPRTVPIAFPGHGGRGSAKFTRVPPVYCNTLTYGCFIDNMHALQFTVIEFLMHCTGPGGDFPMHCITAPVDFRYWGNHCSGADRSGLCRVDVGCAGSTLVVPAEHDRAKAVPSGWEVFGRSRLRLVARCIGRPGYNIEQPLVTALPGEQVHSSLRWGSPPCR